MGKGFRLLSAYARLVDILGQLRVLRMRSGGSALGQEGCEHGEMLWRTTAGDSNQIAKAYSLVSEAHGKKLTKLINCF